jgi:hypothetical protein
MKGKNMRNQMLRAIGGASLAILMSAVLMQGWVSARGQNNHEQGLVGSWSSQVTLRDCQTDTPLVTFPAMNTYNQGGTSQQTAIPGPDGPALPGHGAWKHHTGRSYSGAFQFFIPNPDGTFKRVIVRSAITLGKIGDEYTSIDTAEIFDESGNLKETACSTTTAKRFE